MASYNPAAAKGGRSTGGMQATPAGKGPPRVSGPSRQVPGVGTVYQGAWVNPQAGKGSRPTGGLTQGNPTGSKGTRGAGALGGLQQMSGNPGPLPPGMGSPVPQRPGGIRPSPGTMQGGLSRPRDPSGVGGRSPGLGGQLQPVGSPSGPIIDPRQLPGATNRGAGGFGPITGGGTFRPGLGRPRDGRPVTNPLVPGRGPNMGIPGGPGGVERPGGMIPGYTPGMVRPSPYGRMTPQSLAEIARRRLGG